MKHKYWNENIFISCTVYNQYYKSKDYAGMHDKMYTKTKIS